MTTSFIASCSVPTDKKTDSNNTADTNKMVDNIAAVDSSSISKKADGPSSLFFEMTNYLDSLGFSYDTVRIKKAGYFSNKNVFVYNDKCFYNIKLPNHQAFHLVGFTNNYDGIDTSKIKKELFYKAKHIYGYFYCEKIKKDETIRDGVVEEWQFENESDAENAGLELNRIKNVAFFYTASFVTRTKNNIYIFHNRGAFDLWHKKTIKRFDKQFDVQYPSTIPNSDKIK